MSRRRVPNALARAFDEAHFGDARTLNLREGLPSGAEAAARADAWLRLKQVEGAREVLVITGRGLHSPGAIPVVRTHVAKRLASLRRVGIIERVTEHTPGSYVVRLTPLGSMPRPAPPHRERGEDPVSSPSLSGLSPDTQRVVREVAARTLESFGVHRSTRTMLTDEMRRQVDLLTRSMPRDADRDGWIHDAALGLLRELDENA